MAIIKQSTFPALNRHGEPVVRLLDDLPSAPMEKTAGIHPEILAYKNQLEPEPGKTYVHILALGAGDFYGPNLNNDHFPWEGLRHDHTKTAHPHLHGYKTFLNAHAFAHHMNKDPEKAYGDVLLSVLNHKMKRVELIVAIDEEKCIRNGGQRTLDKIKAGEYPSTSMGCRVPFDVCSICGHKAKYRSEYCDHMRNNAGKIMADGRKVFVYNPYPRFFDISFVFIGADRTSFVLEKVAHQKEAKALLPALAGTAAGGVTGFLTSEDGNRLKGTLAGATTGGVIGGIGGKMGYGTVGPASFGIMGASMAAPMVAGPPPPAQNSSAGRQKLASADEAMRRALRRSSGTVQPFTGMRIKRKVSRQKTNKIRPLTFSKLKQHAKSTQFIMDARPAKLPEYFMKNGLEMAAGTDKEMMHIQKKVAALKSAEVTKISDIFKDVDAHPMGKAVPMLVHKDPDIDCGTLDRFASQPDLGRTLGGLGSAGIVLKPREFQRVVLMRTGQRDLANDLHNKGHVFSQVEPVTRSMRIVIRAPEGGGIPHGLMDMISGLIQHRSALTPMAFRRPNMVPNRVRVIQVRSPMLDKVAELYNGYREDLLLNSEELMKTAMHTPLLMRKVEDMRGGSYLGGGPSMEALSHVPVAYFSHAYWSRCGCDRKLSNYEFAKKFVEENPEIAKYLSLYVAKHGDMV